MGNENQKPAETNEKVEKKPSNDGAAEKKATEEMTPQDVLRAAQAERRRIQAAGQGAVPDVELVDDGKPTRQEKAQEQPRVKENADGSKVEMTRQADGKDHPTKVVHADGTSTTYTYDEKGRPNGVCEFDASGKKLSDYKTADGNTWVRQPFEGAAPNLPAQMVGRLSLDDQGNHVFTDTQNKQTMIRTAEGHLMVNNQFGRTVFRDDVTAEEKAAAQAKGTERTTTATTSAETTNGRPNDTTAARPTDNGNGNGRNADAPPSFLPQDQPQNGNAPAGADRQVAQNPAQPNDARLSNQTQDVQAVINHIVKQGETLSGIVAKQYGLKNWNDIARVVNEIAKQNGITNPDRIDVNQNIKMPEKLPQGTTSSGGQSQRNGGEQQERPRPRQNRPSTGQGGEQSRPGGDTKPGGGNKPGGQTDFAPPMNDTPAKPPEKPPEKPAVSPEEAKVDRKAMEKAVDEFYAVTEGKWGTDEDKVNALLKGKTEAERKVMNDIYVKKHGMTLEQQIKNEMSGSDLNTALDLLKKKDPAKPPEAKPQETSPKPQDGPTVKPQESQPRAQDSGTDKPAKPPESTVDTSKVDRAKIEKDAEALHAATEAKWFRSDSDKVFDLLKNKTEAEKKVLNDIYKEKYGKSVDDMLLNNMSGDNMRRALSMYNAKDSGLTAEQKASAEKAAEAIDHAANGGFLGMGTDKKAIQEQLKGKSKEELEAINEAYKQKYGHGIETELIDEMGGSDLTKTKDLLKGNNDDAARINATLEEHKEWGWSARSNANCEKDLRDTLSTMNEKQIAELDKTYQERYGKSLREVLMNDENLPADQKAALEVYLKGVDKRTPDDYTKLADLALKNKSIEMFEETFAGAPPEVRKKFLDEGGEQKIKAAFGTPVYSGSEYGGGEVTYADSADTQHALDYVKSGKLDVSTKIRDNTGVFGDNEKAIEDSIGKMSKQERESYAEGKKLADKDPATLNDAQKEQVEYYKKVHAALDGAANDREMAKWEDMITYGKDGSLVSKLAAHGGMIDDGMGKVLGTIEGMSQEDWKRLKEDPEYRKKVEAVLAVDLSDSEMARAREALDKKMAAADFESSKNAQRSVLDAVKDETGFWNNDEAGIISRLEKMTPDEQKKYREDPEFKKQVDQAVRSSMDFGPERDAAMQILDNIAKGKSAEGDIVTKLNMHAADVNTDEAKVVADIEEAFRKDPTLRDRLRNPQTPEDKELAQKFDTALRRSLDPGEYETYAKPLLENGRIPMEVKAKLYNGVFDDDEKGFYDSLKKGKASEEDYKELLANPEKTMGFLSAEEREVALNIARQKGEMLKEDELRAAMIGAGTTEEAIKETLRDLTPEQKEQVKLAYEKKYGSNLLGDLMSELGGQDKTEAARDLRQVKDAREAYNEARTEVYESVDGIGKAFVKNAWDGTADMTQDQLEQYSKAMSEYAKQYKEMPLEEQKKLSENLTESLKLFQESKAAAADAVVDATIIAAGIAGASFTGGVSLSVLAYTSIGGALFKVGAKSAIMGADYDFASAQVLTDGATGAIDAATIVLGPAQCAQMLKLGEKAAGTAATAMLSQVDDVAKATGKQLLKEGVSEKLGKEMFEQVAYAISNGAKEVDGKAMTKLAEKFAANADDVPQLQKMLVANLNKAIEAESANALKATMREVALNSASGGVGGSLSGAVRGGVEGESFESAMAGAASGGLAGAGMAGVFTVGFKAMGKGFSAAREHMPEFKLGKDAPTVKVDGAELKLNKAGRVSEVTGADGAKVKIDYHAKGDLEGQVKRIQMANGTEYSSKDGVNWHVKDRTHPDGGYDVKGKMDVSHDGTVKWQAEGGDAHVIRPDGSRGQVDKLSGDVVLKDADGRVVDVSGANTNTRYEYDADKKLQKISFQDGSSVERGATTEGGGPEWLIKDKATPEGRLIQGEQRQLSDGTIVIVPKDGSGELHIHPSGGKTQHDGSGNIVKAWNSQGGEYEYKYDSQGQLSEVWPPGKQLVKRVPGSDVDASGRITKVYDSWGSEGEIAYNAEGKIVGFKEARTYKTYTSEDGINWTVVDRNNSFEGVESKVKGEFTFKDTGEYEFRHATGEVEIKRPDGLTVTTKDGDILSVQLNNGQRWTKEPDGQWRVFDASSPGGSYVRPGEMSIKDNKVYFQGRPDRPPSEMPTESGGWMKRYKEGIGGSSPHKGEAVVAKDGSVTFPMERDMTETHRMDGGIEYRDSKGRLFKENLPDGAPKKLDVDGRPTDSNFRRAVREKFGDMNESTTLKSMAKVREELDQIKGIDHKGMQTSAYESLMRDPTLSDAQKDNIIRNLAEVREHFASYRAGDRMHPDPEVNWIHTQGELAKVLEAGRAKKLTATEMEDALLASMYSDSVKFAFPPPKGAEANFFTHHLDGALAASENLKKQGFPQERIDRIVQAIKEHQIAPPEFMGQLYHFKMKSGLDMQLANGKISQEQHAELSRILNDMSVLGDDGKIRIRHIANPNDAPKFKADNGEWEVAFTTDPKDAPGVAFLLNQAGIDRWTVPVDPRLDPNFSQLSKVEQEKLVSKFKISQTLIDGDGVDNYATLGGASKIVAIRGPETMFKDPQIWNSIESIDASFKDAYNVLSPEGKKLADATLAERNAVLFNEKQGIKAQMDIWLKEKGFDPATDKIPFYNADLKYPDALNPDENNALAALRKKMGEGKLSAEEATQLRNLQYKGLTDQQIKDYEFAKQIRGQMTDFLRIQHRTDGRLPGNYDGIRNRSEYEAPPPVNKFSHMKEAQKLELPEGTRAADLPVGSTTIDNVNVMKGQDGQLMVSDLARGSSKSYDANGKVTEVFENGRTRKFGYDADGKLNQVEFSEGGVWKREGNEWVVPTADGSGTQKFSGDVVVDADGTVKSFDKDGLTRFTTDGAQERYLNNGRVDYLRANYEVESRNLTDAVNRGFADQPQRAERFNKLREQFEVEAAKRGLSENDKALLYKQLNRMMIENPGAAIPFADRMNLAEQVLNHSAFPETVSQGANGTCNVTTLEHRNYMRNPDKNAQVVADVALRGDYTFADGKNINMFELNNGIRPDKQARNTLDRQGKVGTDVAPSAQVHVDGERTYASQIVETAMVNNKWRSESKVITGDGRIIDEFNFVYGPDKKLLGVINDKEKDLVRLYDKDGNRLTTVLPGQEVYSKDKKLIPFDESKLVYDQYGSVRGMVSGEIKPMFDANGEPLDSFKMIDGFSAYDKDGKMVVTKTRPGDLYYDRVPDGTSKAERVYWKGGTGEPMALKKEDGKLFTRAEIYTNQLQEISEAVNGFKEKPFVITFGHQGNTINVGSKEELLKAFQQLKADNNLPAVLQVNVFHPPFGNGDVWPEAGEGWHVVTLHSIYELDKEVGDLETKYGAKFVNQWRQEHNMDVPLTQIFKALEPPPPAPPPSVKPTKWQRIKRFFSRNGDDASTDGGAKEVAALPPSDVIRVKGSNDDVSVAISPEKVADIRRAPDSGGDGGNREFTVRDAQLAAPKAQAIDAQTQALIKQNELAVISKPGEPVKVMIDSPGDVYSGLDRAMKVSNGSNKPITLDWNGAAVEIKPGMTKDEAIAEWHRAYKAHSESPAVLRAQREAQERAERELAQGRLEVDALRGTPHRQSEDMIADLYERGHQKGTGAASEALTTLKHPDEIRDFVQYYAGKNPATVIENLRFAVDGGEIVTGTEQAWKQAIDELSVKMPEPMNSPRIAEIETQQLLAQSFKQEGLMVTSPLSSLTDPNQSIKVMLAEPGNIDDALAKVTATSENWNRPLTLDWNGRDVEVNPGMTATEARANWEASFSRDVSSSDTDEVVGGRKVKGLWAPERDFEKLSFDERNAVYEMLDGKTSPLSDFAVADSFAEKAMKSVSGWTEDLKVRADEITKINEAREKSTGKFMELINHPDYPMSKYHDVDFARQFWAAKDPEQLKVIDEYVKNRDIYWQKGKELDDLLKDRHDTLQRQLDAFADEQGLPRVEIRLRDPQYMGASRASYNDNGIVTLNKADLYSDKSGSRLIGSLYHEFTHSEQQSIFVNRMADQLGIDRVPTDTDVKLISELYKDRIGRAPTDDHLKAILEARGKRENLNLSEAELTRAEAMETAWKNNQPVGDKYVESENDFRVTRGELRKLQNDEAPSAPTVLLEKLYNPKGGKVLSKRLFGTEQPPPEIEDFYRRYRASNGDTDAEIAARVRREPPDELSLDFTQPHQGAELDLTTGAIHDPQSLDFSATDLDFSTSGNRNGFDHLSEDERMDLYRPATQKELGRVMRRTLNDRLEEINTWREGAYDNYMQVHEYDAWVSGEKARSRATMHGAHEGDDVSIDGTSWKVDESGLDQMRGGKPEIDQLRGQRPLDQIVDQPPIQAFDGRVSDTPVVTRDGAGRVTESVHPDGHHKYTYDGSGELTKIDVKDGLQAERQSDGTWLVKNDPQSKPGEYVFDGEMSVSQTNGSVWKEKDGTLQVYRTDGGSEVQYSDGTSIIKNADGKVTDTEFQNSVTRAQYGYDGEGKLSSITMGDGMTATKQEDGTWLVKGDPAAHGQDYVFKGDFEVMSLDGALWKTNDASGTLETLQVDGSSSTMFRDGRSVHRDINGKVRNTEYRNGTQRSQFGYSESGELTSVVQKNGFTAEKQSDGSWLITGDPNANNGGQPYRFDGDIEVMSATGSVWKTSDSGLQEIFDADGAKQLTLSDGTHVMSDSNGRVTGTQFRNGEQRADFGYSNTGELNSVNIENRLQATKQDDGTWKIVRANGTEEVVQGEIRTMRTGDVVIEAENGRPWETFHADGGHDIDFPNGGSVYFDANGRVRSTEFRHGNRRTFQYDGNGQLARVEADGNILARDSRGWALIDDKNRIVTPLPDMNIVITNGGDIEMTGVSHADKVIRHLDGTVEEIHPKAQST